MKRRQLVLAACTLSLLTGAAASALCAETTLRVVMHSGLKIIDPIWTTAYIARDHGYMVYDTLFAMDEKGEIKPQMVDHWSVSDDALTYTFTLREGLTFHDGQPVTAADAVASLKRWASRDSMGQNLMSSVRELVPVDARTFRLTLSKPFSLVLAALGKPSSNAPFVMPKRIAETPATEQIQDATGSGPFVLVRDQWRPGSLTVYSRFKDYKPRQEAPSWASGGKLAKVDRVEWITMPDQQTAVNALIAGEVDLIEQAAHNLLPILEANPNVTIDNTNEFGFQYMLRFNSLHPPFDNPKIRRAALAAINQEDFLKAAIGDTRYYRTCGAMFVCGTAFATDKGSAILMRSDFELSRRLLAEAAYDGTPVLLLHATDVPAGANLPPVAKQLLERGGFKVNMVSMDWQSVIARRAKKDPPAQGGWNAFFTFWTAADVLNPISNPALNVAGDKGWFGWFQDAKLDEMKDQFAREKDPAKQKALAEAIQVYALEELVTHAHLGQYLQPMAYRKDRISGVLKGPSPYFWNIAKN